MAYNTTTLTDSEIRSLSGRPADPQEPPASRSEAARAKLDELDQRMHTLVQKHRLPHESHAAATARLMQENPALYTEHKAAAAQIMRDHGIANGASGLAF